MARIVIERQIAARPETVWEFVSSPDGWLQWQGTAAEISPEPGGAHRVNIRGDAFASGSVVEVAPPRRISFTWGFEIPDHPIPSGSTLVTIELVANDGGTLLRLTQERIPEGFDAVRQGWEHYLDRLVVVAEGLDPGPDPLVGGTSH